MPCCVYRFEVTVKNAGFVPSTHLGWSPLQMQASLHPQVRFRGRFTVHVWSFLFFASGGFESPPHCLRTPCRISLAQNVAHVVNVCMRERTCFGRSDPQRLTHQRPNLCFFRRDGKCFFSLLRIYSLPVEVEGEKTRKANIAGLQLLSFV